MRGNRTRIGDTECRLDECDDVEPLAQVDVCDSLRLRQHDRGGAERAHRLEILCEHAGLDCVDAHHGACWVECCARNGAAGIRLLVGTDCVFEVEDDGV